MAVTRATKNVYMYGSTNPIQYVGSLFEQDTPCVWAGQYVVSEDEGGVITSFDCGNNNGLSLFTNSLYYNSTKAISLADLLVKGTSYNSAYELLSALMSHVENDIILVNGNGDDSNLNYEDMQSVQQGYYAGTKDGNWYRPYITMSVRDNTFNPGDMSRSLFFQVQLDIARASWNSTTNKWNNNAWSVNTRICFNHYTGNDYTKVSAAVSNFATRLENMFLTIGPGCAFGASWGVIHPAEIWAYIKVVDDPACVTKIGPYAMRVVPHGYMEGPNWNASGSIEPTPKPEPGPGPGPDPDEPLPPPKPGPDDPPQPVDPVEPIPEPNDPPLDGTNCGIYSIYSPNRSQLRQLGAKLWDPNVWDIIKQYFTTPMDAVFSLAILPVQPSTSGTEAIVIGNYNSHVGAAVVNSDYATVNCGSVYIPKFFNSYLDYDPYTTYKLFLPFIGEVDLNADEITAQNITIKYKVNVVTGDCVAFVMKGSNVFAEYNGNCARFLPLSSASYAAFIQATTAFAAAAVTAGASLAGAGATGEAIESGLATASGEMSGNGMVRLAGNVAAQQSIGANLASSGINAVMGSKMSYSKAGRIGQGAGQIAVRTPYITVIRPNLTLPEKIDQASSSALRNYIGYSTNKIGPLSSFSGFTVVEACQLSSQHATDSEIAEALSMMKGGIII